MDVGEVLLDILVILVAAKVAAEVAERIGIPAVVGEIVAGALIGPSVLGLASANETVVVLGEIGVILLLLQVGMEMNLAELGAVGRASLTVASIGVAVPMLTGYGVASALGEDSNTALFLGAALAATSVGITARVFSDLRALATVEARTVLGAAVADDVMGLVILTVVVRIVTGGSVSVTDVAMIVGVALAFLVVAALVGTRLAPGLFHFLDRRARSAGTLVALAFAFTLAFAELADMSKLAPIVGAFVAGLSLSQSSTADRIHRELAPVGHLFVPVFFLLIGIEADVSEFVEPGVLKVAGALLAVAIVGKFVAAYGMGRQPGDRLLVGFGMIPRGEVGLIFATIGLREGVLDRELYAALVLVVLATTLATPPLLRARVQRLRAARREAGVEAAQPRPAGGWLQALDGVVDLAALPPARLRLNISLDAARRIAQGSHPGPRLLDWLGGWDDEPLQWDRDATEQLFAVLTAGNVRAWRFLETTGTLQRALPELEEALRRRRADPYLLDPAQVLQFDLVERIRTLVLGDAQAAEVHAQLQRPEWLLLAALIFETAGDKAEPVELARRLAHRLDLGAAAEQELALLVGDSDLFRAAARRVDALDEEVVFPLVSHLDRPERSRALYLLTLALDELTPWDRERLDRLFQVVTALLEQPEVSGRDARNLVERRRTEAMRLAADDARVSDRILHAPRAYVLAQASADIVRQAALLEPLPARSRVRASVLPIGPAEWRVEVASRDRRGLLATISGVLARRGLDIVDAVVATWGDGGALDSFVVRRAEPEPAQLAPDELAELGPPDPGALETAIVEAMGAPLVSPPNPDADVRFDDHSSPWYTVCEVRSPDRRGLLHTIAVGIASAGASIHSARLVTTSGTAVDRFELTDGNDRKLDEVAKAAISEAIRTGVTVRRRVRPRRR